MKKKKKKKKMISVFDAIQESNLKLVNRHYTGQEYIECSECFETKHYSEFFASSKKCKGCLKEIVQKRGEGLPTRVCCKCGEIKYPKDFAVRTKTCLECRKGIIKARHDSQGKAYE